MVLVLAVTIARTVVPVTVAVVVVVVVEEGMRLEIVAEAAVRILGYVCVSNVSGIGGGGGGGGGGGDEVGDSSGGSGEDPWIRLCV